MNEPLLSKEEIRALALRGLQDPAWFLRTFLPRWFPLEQPWVHLGIIAILTRRADWLLEYPREKVEKIKAEFVFREDPDDEQSPLIPIFVEDESGLHMRLGKYTLIMMPRGFSKTTLANGIRIWKILYRISKVPVYISETATHAEQQLTNIAQELASNEMIAAVFGQIKPEQRNEGGLRWAESSGIIQTLTGVTVYARGRGAQIRGMNVGGDRPDDILPDDLEDAESVATEEQRAKTKAWFFGDVLPALPELNPDATITVLGTLRHADSLLISLMRDPAWTTVIFGVTDRAGEPLWAAMMDADKIEGKRLSYARQNLLHVFYLEYHNTVRAPENAKFRQEMIVYGMPDLKKIEIRAIALDPAISKKRQAARSAIVVVGIDPRGYLVVLDAWAKRGATPREQIDMYFEMHYRWLPEKGRLLHGIESIAYQASLEHFMREEMFRQARTHGMKAYFDITGITHSRSEGTKEERIEGMLQPRYAAGVVRHLRRFSLLEAELLDFPNGTRDVIDAEAMAVSLLDDFAGIAGGWKDSEDNIPDLAEVIGGEWRWA